MHTLVLKHLSSKKIKKRDFGKCNLITRQPTQSGRAKGIRLGEMERDCLMLHEVPSIITERLITNCDISSINICRTCGIFEPNSNHIHDDIIEVSIPHTTKVVLQEALALGIQCHLKV